MFGFNKKRSIFVIWKNKKDQKVGVKSTNSFRIAMTKKKILTLVIIAELKTNQRKNKMNKLETILDMYPEEEFLKADGYDDAIIGVVEDFNSIPRLAYSIGKIIDKLSEDMTHEEAVEFFEFNIQGAYVGEQTPVYVYDTIFTE